MLLHVFKWLKGMNVKCLNDIYSVKQLSFSMHKSVKLVQPQRKTTTVGLKTISYLGPNCEMTMLYYVMGCEMRTFSPLNALLMIQI